MRLILFIFLEIFLRLSHGSSLNCHVANNGSYTVTVNSAVWFRSDSTFTTVDGITYSSGNGTLKMIDNPKPVSGSDIIGKFEGTSMNWKAGSTLFQTTVKIYATNNVIVFEQSFPDGAKSPTVGSENTVLSSFPSFIIEDGGIPRGYVTFSGRFLEGSKPGKWAKDNIPSGASAGPLCIFEQNLENSVVVSPFNQFMTGAFHQDKVGHNEIYRSGLIGTLTDIPKGYSYQTVISLGTGVTQSMKRWGDLLLRVYKKQPDLESDISLNYLGFSTDNGAFYYYNTEKLANGTKLNYEDTLLDVHTYAKAEGIPYQYVLLDSWWYFKGPHGGVKEWAPMPNIFPHGLQSFKEKTGWKVQAHNKYWDSGTTYATQNGGSYKFIVEDKMALPMEQRFWDDLIANATSWGLHTYEQDWLYNELEGVAAILESPILGRQWLVQMGLGASKSGVSIQYCMAYPRHVLQSVEIPAVTQFRASDDYHPGQSTGCHMPYCVYNVGTTSIIAWALGLAPSKDNFWSTARQTDSPYHNDTEPFSYMQGMISSYTTGPVQPSDKIGRSNVPLIMMSCRKDGLLLQPTRPATAIDVSFVQSAFGKGGPIATRSHNMPVWSTHTLIGTMKWAHIIAIGLNATFDVSPSMLPLDISSSSTYLAYKGYGNSANVTLTGVFSDSNPITIPSCLFSDFQLWHAAPVLSNGMTLLGEMAKWVPVSQQRIHSINVSSKTISVSIKGAAGEIVELSFADTSKKISAVSCTLPASGQATISFPDGKCHGLLHQSQYIADPL